MGQRIEQYTIYWINLDPTIGSEIKKTRPCIVISPNEMNFNLRTIIIAPITSKSKDYPTRIKVKVENRTGWIMLDQIRTVDKKRIFSQIDKADKKIISQIKSIINEMLVM